MALTAAAGLGCAFGDQSRELLVGLSLSDPLDAGVFVDTVRVPEAGIPDLLLSELVRVASLHRRDAGAQAVAREFAAARGEVCVDCFEQFSDGVHAEKLARRQLEHLVVALDLPFGRTDGVEVAQVPDGAVHGILLELVQVFDNTNSLLFLFRKSDEEGQVAAGHIPDPAPGKKLDLYYTMAAWQDFSKPQRPPVCTENGAPDGLLVLIPKVCHEGEFMATEDQAVKREHASVRGRLQGQPLQVEHGFLQLDQTGVFEDREGKTRIFMKKL